MDLVDVKKILITEEEINNKVAELGKSITKDFEKQGNLLVICILKGSCIFFADLIRAIKLPIEIDFLAVSSYHDSSVSSGEVKILKDISVSIGKKNILFVEDIIDTGFTMSKIKEMFKERGANTVKLCALLSKPDRRKVPTKIDYEGFKIPDEFVIGYGLDYAEKYRNLPYVGILNEEVYA
jgi:hypoxanthine phosphoribosyltransferase